MSIEAAPRTLSEEVAEEIRAQLGRKRISQAELARKLGVSGTWVSYRLAGKQPIDLNDLAGIAATLDVAVADLIPSGPVLVPPLASSRYRKRSTSAYGLARTIVRDRPQTSASRPATYGAKRRPREDRPGAVQRRRRGAAV
jgi:transcriptional regulator with XRE-family HTH domain